MIRLAMTLKSFSADDPGSWDELFREARIFDEAGVDRLMVSDHVVFGEHLEEYGRPEIGGALGQKQPTGPDGHWLEPLTVLSVVAGMTSRIRLGTNIIIAALRRPVVLAKSAATLDLLSGGRLDLGVGVGWQREEYEAAGLDFDNRGRLLDHTLEVCQTLWREQRAHYESDELTFDAIHQMPKPTQPGGVPIWVSGTVNPRVVRRLAQFGSGWSTWGLGPADFRDGIARMKDELATIGFAAHDLRVQGYMPVLRKADGSLDIERTMDAVPELASAGLTDLIARFPLPPQPEEALAEVQRIVAAFRLAAGRADS
jgi:probable F420-dependent oxidoreductase